MAADKKTPRSVSRLVPAIVTALALLWTAGAVAVPWLASQDSLVGGWLRLVYKPGCHQISDRCLDLGFGPMAVCSRCMGLYAGGCLGLLWTTLSTRSWRPRPRWLLIAAMPTVLDFALGQVGLPSLGNWARFALALPLGLLAGLFLGDALLEIVRRNTNPPEGVKSPEDSVG